MLTNKSESRRNFLKNVAVGSAGMIAASSLAACNTANTASKAAVSNVRPVPTGEFLNKQFETPNIMKGMPIRATFLDEVTWDIPHQNWGVFEWDRDFAAMKAMGINTVVMIRSGLAKWIASPFECILKSEDVYYPPVDLTEMFLTLADKHGLDFYFGMYDSGKYWIEGSFQKEIDLNLALIDEVWEKYGQHHKSFQGWYLSQEVSRRTKIWLKFSPKLVNMQKLFRVI